MTSVGEGASAADLQVQVHYRLIEALQESEQRLAEAQRVANLGSWSFDLATEELTWSDQMYRLLGRNPGDGEINWAGVLAQVPEEERDRCEVFVAEAVATGTPGSFDFPIVVEGERRWLHSILAFDKDAQGHPVRIHGITQDVTAEHEARRIVEELKGRFQTIVENVSDIVTIVDRDGILRYSSPSPVLGGPIGSMYGTSILDLLHPDDARLAAAAVDRLRRMGQGSSVDVEVRLRHADGSWRTFSSIGKNLIDDPAIGGFLFVSRDVTAERRLEHGLRHDPLTGLPNRSALGDLAEGAFARAARREGVSALLVVDLDKFHTVNEQYGYEVGDSVLIEVARRLDIAFRVSDGVARANSNVGRFAGDEFLVLCEQVDPAKVPLLWSRVDDALREPVPVGDATVALSASVGVSVTPPERRDFTVALHQAETAVRVVKDRGGGGFALFDESLGQHERVRVEARRRLEAALGDGQLRLHYQPKVSLVTGRIVASEGLLRWEDPERGLVPPFDFIPLAEETGLIVPIGAWVIEEACRQGARWEAMFPNRPPLLTCVNVSARQFGPALVDTVAAALAATGLPASRLGLEVTESALMTDVHAAADVLRRLGELGVSLSIDDFGTGYSSLAYLKQFELHELKIDKSFVDGLGRDANDSSIVAAVIALAHALDLGVVAEGVETNEQAERLRSMGCEVAQGYLFARPAPAEAMELLLSEEAIESWEQHGEVPQWGGEASPTAFRAERVLVVDDSPEIRMLARMSLAAVGFEVHEATDGRTGVEVAKAIRPDCVLLDVNMPGLSGFDVCRELRGDPSTSDVTIVMLTAHAGAGDKVEAYSHGADDYIIKPFAPRDLSTRVQSAIRRRTHGIS